MSNVNKISKAQKEYDFLYFRFEKVFKKFNQNLKFVTKIKMNDSSLFHFLFTIINSGPELTHLMYSNNKIGAALYQEYWNISIAQTILHNDNKITEEIKNYTKDIIMKLIIQFNLCNLSR
jgi:hypothetical protein